MRDREIEHLWSVIAGIVLLGQIDFEVDEFRLAKPKDDLVVADVAELLGVTKENIIQMLCYRYTQGLYVVSIFVEDILDDSIF